MFWPTDDFLKRLEENLAKKKAEEEAKANEVQPRDMRCERCKDWFHKVMPNRDDGGFRCWLCTKNPWR